MWSIDLCGL